MLIPAVAMMLLSVSSCDSGIQKGTIDDVLAAIPGGASAATMPWRQAGDVCGLGGDVGDLFGRVCRLSASDVVVLVHPSDSRDVLVTAISDVAVAEDATADWERVDLGRDAMPGRVCVASGGTVIIGGRFAWLVPSVTDVAEAVHIVSSIPDAGGALPQPVREKLKSCSSIVMALSIDDKYLTATVSDKENETVIRGELRDSAGVVYDLSEYAQPLDGPMSDRQVCAAVAVGLRRGTMIRAVSQYLQPRLGVKEKLACAAVSDILRDVCGTLRATLEKEGAAAVVRVSMPYAEGGAAATTRRMASMIQRFGHQGKVHVEALGDTLMQLKIAVDFIPTDFGGFAPTPTITPDKDADVLMALAIAPISEGIVRLDGVEAVVHRDGFVVTLHGTDLHRLLMMTRGEDDDADDEQSDE